MFHRRIYPDAEDKLVGLTFAQDYVAVRGQGMIADRDTELLGKSDLGIVTLRRLFWRELDKQRAGLATKQWCKRSDSIAEMTRQRAA